MSKKFNELVKSALKLEKISLRELARSTGLDVSFLSKILNGKRNPPSSEKDIKKIALKLKIDSDRLMLAAGRIPARLIPVFNDESFVESLLKGNSLPLSKLPKKIKRAPLKSTTKKRTIKGLEVELL